MSKVDPYEPSVVSSPSRLPRLESRRAKSSELDELRPIGRIRISLEDEENESSRTSKTSPNRKALRLDPVYRISVTSPAFSRSYDGVPKVKKSPVLRSPQSSQQGSNKRDVWRPSTAVEPSIQEDFEARLQKLKEQDDPSVLARIEALHNEFLVRCLNEVSIPIYREIPSSSSERL